MLKRLAVAMVFVCLGTVARADTAGDCANSKVWPEAIKACTVIIAKDPRAGWAYINRCFAYERNGEASRALPDCNKAIELDPRNATAWVNRAAAYIALKNYNRALTETNRAIELDPRSAVAFVNRAYASEQLGDRTRAIADYQRTLEINPDYQYAKDALKRLGASEPVAVRPDPQRAIGSISSQ
jgi:tetratricopeptide (TPR) repeat protein